MIERLLLLLSAIVVEIWEDAWIRVALRAGRASLFGLGELGGEWTDYRT